MVVWLNAWSRIVRRTPTPEQRASYRMVYDAGEDVDQWARDNFPDMDSGDFLGCADGTEGDFFWTTEDTVTADTTQTSVMQFINAAALHMIVNNPDRWEIVALLEQLKRSDGWMEASECAELLAELDRVWPRFCRTKLGTIRALDDIRADMDDGGVGTFAHMHHVLAVAADGGLIRKG